jgi:hypothetical protein
VLQFTLLRGSVCAGGFVFGDRKAAVETAPTQARSRPSSAQPAEGRALRCRCGELIRPISETIVSKRRTWYNDGVGKKTATPMQQL